MFAATVVLAVIVGGGFLTFGSAKMAGVSQMVRARDHLGLTPGLFKLIGGLEVLGGLGVLLGLVTDLALLGVLAGLGLIGMTIGATFYHQKAGDPMKEWLPAVMMGSLAIIYIIFRIGTA